MSGPSSRSRSSAPFGLSLSLASSGSSSLATARSLGILQEHVVGRWVARADFRCLVPICSDLLFLRVVFAQQRPFCGVCDC